DDAGDDAGTARDTGAGSPPVMTPAPPMVPPPPGVMSPSSPLDRNLLVDEGHPANELLQPGRTRARTRAYHQASTSAHTADHALLQPAPAQRTSPSPAHLRRKRAAGT
ncbi:unnamed protein product, partial [Laminaria digitata]